MENTKELQPDRFYKMDKALQLIEGTNVAAFWAHLIDAYNYFEEEGKVDTENTLYQAAKVTQAFTGMGTKSQNTAKQRLKELGFLKYKVASKPGEATKSTFFIFYPKVYKKWAQDHDYDKLRGEKYNELQITGDRERLNQWLNENTSSADNQLNTDLGQKQSAEGTFANHTKGHLQSSPRDISKVPKEHVIETIEVDTIEVDTKQTTENGVVYMEGKYNYLYGKSKGDILKLIIDNYSERIKKEVTDGSHYSEDRFIGSIKNIERIFNKFTIDVGVNFYIGILGYLHGLSIKLISNPKSFDTAHKLENLLKFNQDLVFSVENNKHGEQRYEYAHRPRKESKQTSEEQYV